MLTKVKAAITKPGVSVTSRLVQRDKTFIADAATAAAELFTSLYLPPTLKLALDFQSEVILNFL